MGGYRGLSPQDMIGPDGRPLPPPPPGVTFVRRLDTQPGFQMPSGLPPAPPGVTFVGPGPMGAAPSVPTIPPEQPKPRGALGRFWDAINTGLVSPETVSRAVTGETQQDLREAASAPPSVPVAKDTRIGRGTIGRMLTKAIPVIGPAIDIRRTLTGPETEEKAMTRAFVLGSAADAADIGSSFTSPLSIALAGTGSLAKAGTAARAIKAGQPTRGMVSKALQASPALLNAAQKVETPARATLTGAGVGFGVQGATKFRPGTIADAFKVVTGMERKPDDMVRPRSPEELQEELTAGSQVAFGGAAGAGTRGWLSRSRAKMVNRKVADEAFSRAELYEAAKRVGIDLDYADASGSTSARLAKGTLANTIGGGGTYDAARARNIDAIHRWADQFQENFSRLSGEAAGSRILQSLVADEAALKKTASEKFSKLSQEVGPNAINAEQSVGKTAQNIVERHSAEYQRNPGLTPQKVWKIVQDLAHGGEPVGAPKGKKQAAGPTRPAHIYSWEELHNLRSDLMDIYRNNPETIKAKPEAWLQQLVKSIDDAMLSQEANLTPEQRATFREANEIWEGLKTTYDNPRHQYYNAVRTMQPSAITSYLGTPAPELARDVIRSLGPDAGVFQRAVAERLLGRNVKGEGYDFKGLPTRLKGYKPEYLDAVLGPEAALELQKMAQVGRKIDWDYNPPGSGRVVAGYADIGAMLDGAVALGLGHPQLAASHAAIIPLEYGLAKLMNNRGFVSRMMNAAKNAPPKKPIRGALGAAAASQQQREKRQR